MTDEKKEISIRVTALVFGVLSALALYGSINTVFGKITLVSDLFTFIMPFLPLLIPLMVIILVYSTILVIKPRALPVFDDNEDAEEMPAEKS